MATKKQKRLIGEARAAIQAEESRRLGLIALEKDRERRRKATEALKTANQKASAAIVLKQIAEKSTPPLLICEQCGQFRGEGHAAKHETVNA